LGVSMDDDGAAQVRPFLKTHPMDYQVAIGSAAIFDQYKIDSLPVTVVFDRSGKQLKRFDGLTDESDIEAAVRQAL
jgi:thioredoxin-like negative regulator of GroEL